MAKKSGIRRAFAGEIADRLRRARFLDKLSTAKEAKKDILKRKGWPHFGREPFSPRLESRVLFNIEAVIKKKGKIDDYSKVKILDWGARSGLYWDLFLEKHPELEERLEITCLNPSKFNFESKKTKLMVGSLASASDEIYKEKFYRKFDLVFSFNHGELATNRTAPRHLWKFLKRRLQETMKE